MADFGESLLPRDGGSDGGCGSGAGEGLAKLAAGEIFHDVRRLPLRFALGGAACLKGLLETVHCFAVSRSLWLR